MRGLPFRQQATLMASARMVGGFEGAGFVNGLFMPSGGRAFMLSVPQKGAPVGWQWGYLQYLHPRLVFVVASNLTAADPAHATPRAIGHVLRRLWREPASVCAELRNDSAFTFFVRPHCNATHATDGPGPPPVAAPAGRRRVDSSSSQVDSQGPRQRAGVAAAWHAAPSNGCPATAPRRAGAHRRSPGRRGVLLAYLFSNSASYRGACPSLFLRSFSATRSADSELILLYEPPILNGRRYVDEVPCSGGAGQPALFGASDGVSLVRVPDEALSLARATQLPALSYRTRLFHWYLTQPEQSGVRYAGILDADMIFQLDAFDAVWPRHAAHGAHGAHGSHGAYGAYGAYASHGAQVAAPQGGRPDEPSAGRGEARGEALHFFVEEEMMHHAPYAAGNGAHDVGVQLSRSRKPHDIKWRCNCKLVQTLGIREHVTAASGERALCSGVRGEARAAPCCTSFQRAFARLREINLGHILGTRRALVGMLETLTSAYAGAGHHCWDQGVLNLLAWTGSFNASRTSIWAEDEGPVKVVQIGGLRDSRGRFLNELGLPYAIVHQIKPGSKKAYAELGRMVPDGGPPFAALLFNRSVQRVSFEGGDRPNDLLYRRAGRASPGDPRTPLPPGLPAAQLARSAAEVPCGRLQGSSAGAGAGDGDAGSGRGAGTYRELSSWRRGGAIEGEHWRAFNASGWVKQSYRGGT